MKQQEKDILTVSYKYLLLPLSPSQTLCQPIVKNLIIVNFYIALMWCFLSFQMLIWCLDSSVRFADVLYKKKSLDMERLGYSTRGGGG